MKLDSLKSLLVPVLGLFLGAAFASAARAVEPSPWLKPDAAAIAKWQSLRFGMFIHWGPASITGHDISWSRGPGWLGGPGTPLPIYDNLYRGFDPIEFNADQWVSIAKAAGMKYIVMVCKHHDGFCLWDTKLTDYNIMHTPLRRDVIKELSEACKKQGMAFGAYYSVQDWYDYRWLGNSPDNPYRKVVDIAAYEKYLLGQTTELIKNYGPLITIWNDGSPLYGGHGIHTIKLVRSLQPDILINDQTGDGGDYGTPEQRTGGFNIDRPWESCLTISAHSQWSWGGTKDGVKPFFTCLTMLIDNAGGDGNTLLNVGPRADGVIDPVQVAVIKQMGDWLAKYGESIYATRGGPFKPGTWGVSTRQGNRIYVHVLKWSGNTVQLPALPARIETAKVLTGGTVDFQQTEGEVTLTVPAIDHAAIDTIIALDVNKPALSIPPAIASS